MLNSKKEVGVRVRHDGVEFYVWAPFAENVDLIGTFNSWQASRMAKSDDGHFFTFIKDAKPGHEYKFVIDTGAKLLTRNDPRAYHTLAGGHSSVIPGPLPAHRKKDIFQPETLNKTILYELHIGTFNRTDPGESGTFESAAQKLNYLSDLGVNAIEIMPIHSMYQDRGWGYAPEYLYSVESSYGGRNHFADFVEASHQNKLSVILDVVYNHFGASDQTDLWQFDGWSENNLGGIYFYNDWRSSTPWGNTRPDYGRPEVCDYIVDNSIMWLRDFKIDGLRLDSSIYMRNVDGQDNKSESDIPEAWSLLQKITSSAKDQNKNTLLIAEDSSTNEYITKNTAESGAGFDAQWDMQFASAIQGAVEPEKDEDRNLSALCSSLMKSYNNSPFERIIFTDSHDTAANGRARLNQEINPKDATSMYSKKRSLLATAILMTAPGIPMILQGQEFMQGGNFNDWQALDWENVDKHRGIVLAHKHLIALRKNTEGQTAGLTGKNINILHASDSDKVIAYHRWDKGGAADDTVVIANFSNRLVHNYYITFPKSGAWRLRFDSSWHGYSNDFKKYEVSDIEVEADGANVEIPPYTVLIYSQSN